jgi:hypothetical protein
MRQMEAMGDMEVILLVVEAMAGMEEAVVQEMEEVEAMEATAELVAAMEATEAMPNDKRGF